MYVDRLKASRPKAASSQGDLLMPGRGPGSIRGLSLGPLPPFDFVAGLITLFIVPPDWASAGYRDCM